MNKGFTLIELLIVVAIIGILAAIAVPNFHDSLIRPKVARMKNDTRVLGMAIENYRLDNDWYPYGKGCDPTKSLCSVCGTVESIINDKLPQIVFPIAYANTIPADLFNQPITSDNKQLDYTLTYAHLFQQVILRNPCGGIPNPNTPASTKKTAWTYSVYSVGPDEKESQYYDLAYWMQMPYDPSNGLRSMGDIQWSAQPPPIWDGGSRWN
ncbi:MAG: prepilin-type N-terminal cleavage/methylation domain-containing protein [bacterium]